MTQHVALYDELTVRQNLRFAARPLRRRATAIARIAEVLELIGLSSRAKDRAGSLSGGMRRRLALGRALLHDPELLILDEPTLGVDVEARHALWGHVRWLRGTGKTVLLSTNHLDEAEALCDRIVVLRDGRQRDRGRPGRAAREDRALRRDRLPRRRACPAYASGSPGCPGVGRIDVTEVGITVHVAHGDSPDAVTIAALDSGLVAERPRPPARHARGLPVADRGRDDG